MYIDFDISCDAKEFGFEGNNLTAEIGLDLLLTQEDQERFPSFRTIVERFEVVFFGITNKLLDSFSNRDIEDVWESLNEDQKKLVNSWLEKKLGEKEIQEKIDEIAADKAEAYYEGLRDG